MGLSVSFAAALHDPRHPARIDHPFLDMVRIRVFGILAGYEDQNDHDTLRTDPVSYEQYQYLPLVLPCAQTDDIVMLSLRHGTATASLGADDDLEYLPTRLRAVWPNERIRVRGDCGFEPSAGLLRLKGRRATGGPTDTAQRAKYLPA